MLDSWFPKEYVLNMHGTYRNLCLVPWYSVWHTPEVLGVLVQALGALSDHLEQVRPKNQSFQMFPCGILGDNVFVDTDLFLRQGPL